METVRAFVACVLDLAATRRVMDLQRAARVRAEQAGWRAAWVPPPNLHITLKFLGEIDVGLVDVLGTAIARVAGRHTPFRLDVGTLSALGEGDDPRVLIASLTRGHERLEAIAADIDASLFDLGFAKAARPFKGHVTLARVKHAPHGASPASLLPASMAAASMGSSHIDELTLYRSDLLRQGAEYHVLRSHPLTAPG